MPRLEIGALSETSRAYLTDAQYRAAITRLIVGPASAGHISDLCAVSLLDSVAVEVLEAAGFPRSPHVRGPFVETVGRGWAGRKLPDCRLVIDRSTFCDLPDAVQPDALFKTWLHESLHGRQPYATAFGAEWRDVRGFEEGLAEGLARSLVIDRLRLAPLLASYSYYVDAYRALATVLEVNPEDLWRSLWSFPPGMVSAGFLRGLDVMLRNLGRAPMTLHQRARLVGRARSAFDSRNSAREPDMMSLIATWEEVLT